MSDRSPLFALIIGISNYQDPMMGKLRNPVADAQDLGEVLCKHFHAERENIRLVLDDKATRDEIVYWFRRHLINNSNIEPGYPMLIYFAGHGSNFRAEGWKTDDGYYESICPFDRGIKGQNGAVVGDIPDRTLGKLILDLCRKKGDNITVILDCCHSGSGTRLDDIEASSDESRWTPRYAPPLSDANTISAMLEEVAESTDDSVSRGMDVIFPARRHPNLSTHVLLAACLQDERAYEDKKTGLSIFTQALLNKLSSEEAPRLTYEEVVDDLEIIPEIQRDQHPQCEGLNKDRLLFNACASIVDRRRVLFSRFKSKTRTRLRVEAGLMHGVVKGTVFSVWRHNIDTRGTTPLGSVVATAVYAVWCQVEPDSATEDQNDSLQDGHYASVMFWANKPIPIAFDAATSSNPQQLALQVVVNTQSTSEPMLLLSVRPFAIVIERRDTKVPAVVWRVELPYDNLVSTAQSLLNRVVLFEMHLQRGKSTRPLKDQVSIQLVQVDPVGEKIPGNLLQADRITLEYESRRGPDHARDYVVELHNNGTIDLWPSLFYFDPAEYTIHKMYEAPSPTMLKPPLRAGQSFDIGNLDSGVPPLSFMLEPGETSSTGFLKLFLSQDYADCDLMVENEGVRFGGLDEMRSTSLSKKNGVWDTFVTTVTVNSI